MVYKSVTLVSVTDFLKRNSFDSPTSYMCFKVILNLFYISKVILKLHQDSTLQVTLL